MLQLTYIRDNKEDVLKRLAIKNFKDAEAIINSVIDLDNSRKAAQKEADDTKAEANSLARQIGDLMKSGKKEEAEVLKAKTAELKNTEKSLDEKQKSIETEVHKLLVTVPNLPNLSVPVGKTPEDNEVVSEDGVKPTLHAGAKPHWELTTKYDIIDFELGVKLTGAGFPVYKGKGARLQRALINFFLDRATTKGYNEVQPPILVNADSGYGTGQLPDKEGQMYHATEDNLYLIPTAEVPITNMYRDVILKESDFPIKNCGYTPCFRREAGSYGKDVRGLNRLHQFDKVEIVQIAHPQESYKILEDMKDYVAGLLKELGLPYRVLKLCGGDMSFGSALTYDLEVWSAAQQRWLEVSSVSNFETFQTNRLKCRYKDEKGKTQLAHSLNGSALALPRIVAALLENNQTENGITIPKVLVPYCGFDNIN
ncbi:serine--tRNA ligase [Aurantibacillus circumpalustris]|uniref:serine--tRNA ligase n=1 Tax=Aurantibacillus circumpalustris TaxID=3036359 RepID=UPI00295AC011|nr:serine--tRNA ligase [Aurantibacillus circumpalustris]